MKKQSLLHLHDLLAKAAKEYESQKIGDLEFEEYETVETRPTSIHKSKADHRAALFAIAHDITSDMELESETEPVAPTAE